MSTDVKAAVASLRTGFKGEVTDELERLQSFARDESIFEVMPRIVASPASEDDLQLAVRVASHYDLPITARGGGTSTAGQAIGSGIVLDFLPHFSKILDVGEESVTVQPGVKLSEIEAVLASKGRRLAPDPSSAMRCTAGGIVANNAAGPHALAYGATADHVQRLRVVLSEGHVVESADLGARFGTLAKSAHAWAHVIRESTPRTRKNSSGYAVASLLSGDWTRLLVGSEGTLALFSEITFRTIPIPAQRTTAVFAYPALRSALEAVEEFRSGGAVAIELMDDRLVELLGRVDPIFMERIGLSSGETALLVEWEGPRTSRGSSGVLRDKASQSELWAIRAEASRRLQSVPGSRRPLRCVEDGVVPVEHLVGYAKGLRDLLRRYDCDGPIFGHAGDGHLHVNPMVDVSDSDWPSRVERLMDEWYGLIERCRGSISGEHGDGLLRRGLAARQWAPLMPLFREVKNAFDPKGILNPGVKVPVREERAEYRKDLRPEVSCLVREAGL